MQNEILSLAEQRQTEQMAEGICASIMKLSEFVRDNSNVGECDKKYSKIMLDSLKLSEEYLLIASAFSNGVKSIPPEGLVKASQLYAKHFLKSELPSE